MNSYIFNIYFILFIFLSNTYPIYDFTFLTLALADTHGIAKYAHAHTYEDTRTHTSKKSRKILEKEKKGQRKKKEGGVG